MIKAFKVGKEFHCLKSSPIQVHPVPYFAILFQYLFSPLLSSFISCPMLSLSAIPLSGDQVSSILSITKQSIHLNHIICAFIPCIHLTTLYHKSFQYYFHQSSKRLLLCTVLTVLSAYIFIYPTLSYYCRVIRKKS